MHSTLNSTATLKSYHVVSDKSGLHGCITPVLTELFFLKPLTSHLSFASEMRGKKSGQKESLMQLCIEPTISGLRVTYATR